MPPPIPRCSSGAYSSLNSPSCFSLPRYGSRIGLHIFLFEACSTFTRVAACTLALSPIRDTLIEGFSHFVTSMTAPIASGWSGCRVGLAPTGKRRLCTAHTRNRHRAVCAISQLHLRFRRIAGVRLIDHVVGADERIGGAARTKPKSTRLGTQHSCCKSISIRRLRRLYSACGLSAIRRHTVLVGTYNFRRHSRMSPEPQASGAVVGSCRCPI
jgi:hypothetical protein